MQTLLATYHLPKGKRPLLHEKLMYTSLGSCSVCLGLRAVCGTPLIHLCYACTYASFYFSDALYLAIVKLTLSDSHCRIAYARSHVGRSTVV